MKKKNLLTKSYLNSFGVSVSKRAHAQYQGCTMSYGRNTTIHRDKVLQKREDIGLEQLLLH